MRICLAVPRRGWWDDWAAWVGRREMEEPWRPRAARAAKMAVRVRRVAWRGVSFMGGMMGEVRGGGKAAKAATRGEGGGKETAFLLQKRKAAKQGCQGWGWGWQPWIF
jgi:hypothetical protein